MKLNEIIEYIDTQFETSNLDNYSDESGITVNSTIDIKKIGYCTNLTLESVEGANEAGVNLLITHHDAWHFIYGLQEACINKLKEYGIAHYFNHLPLDDSDFGTNESLIKVLGLKSVKKTHLYDGYYCGRVAEFEEAIPFLDFAAIMEDKLGESIKAWQFNDKPVKRVGLVCGAGGETTLIKESIDLGCDTYISGEKNLYSIQYADFKETNLMIGSHTFTEIFGVDSLVKKIKEQFDDIEIVLINESHCEAKDNRDL